MGDHNENYFDIFTRMFAGPTLVDMFMDPVLQGAAQFDLRSCYKRALEVAPDGRGQPVMVMPGYSHDDSNTEDIRNFIAGNKFDPRGLNYPHKINGPTLDLLQHTEREIEKLSREHNGRKVAVVAHSLGGMIAEAMARKRPDLISKVIVLGSPIHTNGDNPTTHRYSHEIQKFVNNDAPLKVPLASIRASHDGILGLGLECLNKGEKRWDDIRIDTSHLGLLCHPSAMVAILDRLAQPSKSWKPFDPDMYPDFKFVRGLVCVTTAPARPQQLVAGA